jgi:hypothetical protein
MLSYNRQDRTKIGKGREEGPYIAPSQC